MDEFGTAIVRRPTDTVTKRSTGTRPGSLYLRCILCEAVIRFRQGGDQRFRDHMRNEHEVSSGHMGFLFAMHFGDPGDRAAWRDAMKPRMDRFRDRTAQERISSLFRPTQPNFHTGYDIETPIISARWSTTTPRPSYKCGRGR